MPKLPNKKKPVQAAAETKAPKKQTMPVVVSREIVYPEVKAVVYHDGKPITESLAKKLLGWEEIEKGEALLTDSNGKRIRCNNNITNRPLYSSVYQTLRQEILRKRWAGSNGSGTTINGEPIIVGKSGLILNGQHTLIALILAVQEWMDDKEKWAEWDSEPVMDKLIIFGIDESDAVVNTMDTCKPRTLAEVIFRSALLATVTSKSVKFKIAKICENAVKMLWHRTGLDDDAFAPKRTHAEAIAFVNNHPKILECVKHIYEEESEKRKVSWYINPGYAAGLLYLMGSCKTDVGADYHEAEIPNEDMLDWEMWDMACEFWMLLAAGDKKITAVREAMESLSNGEERGSLSEKSAILCKAWIQYSAKKPITEKSIALEYEENEDGKNKLVECPIVGGIDRGNPSEHDTVDPTPEEVEERAEAIKQEREAKKKAGPKPKGKKPAVIEEEEAEEEEEEEVETDSDIQVGVQVWIEEDGGHWTGKITAIDGDTATVKTKTGKSFDVPVADCLTELPEDE